MSRRVARVDDTKPATPFIPRHQKRLETAPARRAGSSSDVLFPGAVAPDFPFQTLTRACTMAGRERRSARRRRRRRTLSRRPSRKGSASIRSPFRDGSRSGRARGSSGSCRRGVAGHPGEAEEAEADDGTRRDAHGAALVAEQLVSTTHSVALFAGLTARMVWLRRARRRRGAPREFPGDGTPLLSEPLF